MFSFLPSHWLLLLWEFPKKSRLDAQCHTLSSSVSHRWHSTWQECILFYTNFIKISTKTRWYELWNSGQLQRLELFLRFKIFRSWWGLRKRTAQQIFISFSQAWFSVCHKCDEDQPCIYLFSVKSTSRINNVMEILGRIF